jgi:hypothetical protein
MSAQKVAIASPAEAAPVTGFSDCHASILQGLDGLSGLPALTQAAARARRVAEATLALFDDIVTAHHADEERELFPAVLRSATPGRERDHVLAIEQRLAAEHRTIEALWRELRPAVRRAATGRPSDLDDEAVRVLMPTTWRRSACRCTCATRPRRLSPTSDSAAHGVRPWAAYGLSHPRGHAPMGLRVEPAMTLPHRASSAGACKRIPYAGAAMRPPPCILGCM